jgi:hypothetical protein
MQRRSLNTDSYSSEIRVVQLLFSSTEDTHTHTMNGHAFKTRYCAIDNIEVYVIYLHYYLQIFYIILTSIYITQDSIDYDYDYHYSML